MHSYFVALIMGIVEGLTEFLPVSSTGHLILTGNMLNFVGEKAATFEIVIQLGAILAVVYVYYDRLLLLLDFSSLRGKKIFSKDFLLNEESKSLNIIHIIVSTIPALGVGYLMHGIIKKYLFSPKTVVIGLIVGGIIMIVSERMTFSLKTNKIDDISFRQALIVGITQCCAMWPGVSRSASTILGGLYCGMDYRTSAEFSFLISIPVMFAATGYDILKSWHTLNTGDLKMLFVGFIVSFIVGLFTVKTFLNIFQKLKLSPFGFYRIAVGMGFLFSVSG